MRTDDLIASLAGGATPVRQGIVATTFARALAIGVGLTLVVFFLFWGIRPDAAIILQSPFLAAKTALPLLLGGLAVPVGLTLARPGGATRISTALWTVPAILGVFIIAALVVTPPAQWQTEFYGSSIALCLASIPILSLPILAGVLFALRRGAPEHPALCGAAAGLIAGGLGAAIYSLFCTEDSPLFYGMWYSSAIVGVVIVGAVIGNRALRW